MNDPIQVVTVTVRESSVERSHLLFVSPGVQGSWSHRGEGVRVGRTVMNYDDSNTFILWKGLV